MTSAQVKYALGAMVVVGGATACSSGTGDADENARRAYLGFEVAVERAVEVALVGFNYSSGPSISPQSFDGPGGGRLLVAGQVTEGVTEDDQDLDLTVTVTGYSEGRLFDEESNRNFEVSYSGIDNRPLILTLDLRGIPDGAFSGSLLGSVLVFDDLGGEVGFDLSLDGDLAETASGDVFAPDLNIRGVVSLGAGEHIVSSQF